MEEPLTGPFFELFYLQAQGGLGHAQSLGGLPEVARLDDGNERRKMAEFGTFIHWAPTLLLNSAGRGVRGQLMRYLICCHQNPWGCHI